MHDTSPVSSRAEPPVINGSPAGTLFGRQASWLTPLPVDPGALLVFTSCDSRYLDFAVSLVRSTDLFSPGFVVALHIVNPTRDDLERARGLAETLVDTRLAISVERIDLSTLSSGQRRAYFASARFLRLAEILHDTTCPILSLDADSLVVAPIDLDFTDKQTAEICLVRRDLHGAVAEHLAVANGSIWMRPTPGAQAVLDAAARDLAERFEAGSADWYVDQIVVGRQVVAFEKTVGIFNLKTRYADWQFGDASVVWSGKGQRKHIDLRFAVLQRLLLDDLPRQALALRVAAELFPADSGDDRIMVTRIQAARARVPARVALFLPRLDQPWGTAFNPRRTPPPLAADTLALRLHWKEFTARLANAIERQGVPVEVLEWPAREIDPETVDAIGAQLALIPHRCNLDFAPGQTPVMYYMQEYFRWVFVVDPGGWSAASSLYPFAPEAFADAPPGPFEEYRQRLAQGRLQSKFGQTAMASRAALEAAGQIPAGSYIFMPLQIPHDQSIRYFSSIGETELVAALVRWCETRGVPLVLKPHPANPKSMAEFEALPRSQRLFWSTAHVQDLIEHASAVYTINSGVGFEALLQVKPVVTFGRVEYDCVSYRASIESLDEAWQHVGASSPGMLARHYGAFVDWFLGRYAVDLSLPESSQRRIDELARTIVARVRTNAASAAA